MEILQGVWKQHLRPRTVVGYGVKIFLPSPPNYVTRSPGSVVEITFKPNCGDALWKLLASSSSVFFCRPVNKALLFIPRVNLVGASDRARDHKCASSERHDPGHHNRDQNPQRSRHQCTWRL